MACDEDAALRSRLTALLDAGLPTEWQQRAYTSEEVDRVVARLQGLAADDYEAKLRTAGFTPHAYRPPEDFELEQGCSTCMYYERNRQYCDLPALDLPVQPAWSCRLWRI